MSAIGVKAAIGGDETDGVGQVGVSWHRHMSAIADGPFFVKN